MIPSIETALILNEKKLEKFCLRDNGILKTYIKDNADIAAGLGLYILKESRWPAPLKKTKCIPWP